MNSFQKLALVTTASALFTAPAFAATGALAQTPSKDNMYIAGNAGYATLATPDKNFFDTEDGIVLRDQSHDIGYFGGGFDLGFNHAINNHVLIGAELGYDYNGQSKYTVTFLDNSTLTGKVLSYDVRFLGTSAYLFNNGVNIFGKAGGARVYQTIDVDDGDYSDSASINELQPMLAAGVGYQVKALNLFVEYSHVFGTDATNFSDLVNEDGTLTHTVAVDSIKAGVSYSFAI